MTASQQATSAEAEFVEAKWRIAEQDAVGGVDARVGREAMELAMTELPLPTRITVDEEASGLLPARQCNTVLSVKDPAEVHANDLAARRFFKRVDGRDLRLQGHRRTAPPEAPAWHRWISAPVDPLLPEEAAAVGVGFTSRARGRTGRRLYVKNDVRPVGMTLQRAIEIAQAAQDAIDNGTAPTYI